MAVRMSQTTPQVADTEPIRDLPTAPRVRILLTAVEGADLEAALAAVRRQVYDPAPEVVVVDAAIEGVDSASSLEDAISSTDSSFDYLWLLHGDARPRPDALAALISEMERNEASLAGSKLLKAGTMDELESVGGATDVFGEPYSGLDVGEIDLQQYDVVREVAFVQSASMLVRRDLAQGLGGLDPLLPPVAAGLDFSQRTRLAGGKVISVPSSEVYHQAHCGQRGRGWREQAGRLRAMITAYSPLTLLWVLPYDFLVSIADSIASLVLLQWRPLIRHMLSWAWNVLHLPSTLKQRRRLRAVRSEGDEELFRFHAKGSVRLRAIGEEVSGRLLSMFDDDQALARNTRRVWGSPGIWGAMIAGLIVFLGARGIIFGGMPNVGFSFPFEAPTVALRRWLIGWTEAGLGATGPVHPSVGVTGIFSLIWFGLEGAARTVSTVALTLVGIVGMGRLGGRIGLRGPGRYLAGLVLVAGPGTAVLAARGSWLSLAAAAIVPWAVRSAFIHAHESGRSRWTLVGWALLTGAFTAALSPVLALVPIVVVALWRALGGKRASYLLALSAGAGGLVATGFVIGDTGWLLDSTRSLGVRVDDVWPVIILAAAVPMVVESGRIRTVAITGGLLGVGSLTLGRFSSYGPGVEEAVFIVASLGAALTVAAALDSWSRSVFRVTSLAGGLALVVLSVISLGNGHLGMPGGDVNERLAFAETLSDDGEPGRILQISVERDVLPGEVRAGPGFWYRTLDGKGTTLDEVWLPASQDGDQALGSALVDIASGGELRPGERLAQFAIDWVVLEGPTSRLDQVLIPQLDLVPIPLDPDARVFQNESAAPLAGTVSDPWESDGVGFAGPVIAGRVPIAMNFGDGWSPDVSAEGWSMTVDGADGVAAPRIHGLDSILAAASLGMLVLALGMIVVGRRKRK